MRLHFSRRMILTLIAFLFIAVVALSATGDWGTARAQTGAGATVSGNCNTLSLIAQKKQTSLYFSPDPRSKIYGVTLPLSPALKTYYVCSSGGTVIKNKSGRWVAFFLLFDAQFLLYAPADAFGQ